MIFLAVFLLVYRNVRNCEFIVRLRPYRPFNLLGHCLNTRLTRLSVVVVVSTLVFGGCNLSFKGGNGLLNGNRLCFHMQNCLACRGLLIPIVPNITRNQTLVFVFTKQMHRCSVVGSERSKLTRRLRLHLIQRNFLVSIHSLSLSAKFGE